MHINGGATVTAFEDLDELVAHGDNLDWVLSILVYVRSMKERDISDGSILDRTM